MIPGFINWLDRQIDWAINAVDAHTGVVTIFVGTFVFVVYLAQKQDHKSNAAKLILQELRYADTKVRNYRVHRSYTFTEKILPTNSWNANIGLFVKELSESELDLISKFYSNAAYLDEVIHAISDRQIKDVLSPSNPAGTTPPPGASSSDTSGLSDEAQQLIAAISSVIVNVFNTPATKKLTEIAEKKWYRLF